VVVVVAGVVGVGGSRLSVAESVKAFLLDWETGKYASAARLTTGRSASVARLLRATKVQLGADDLALKMGPISTGRNTARAFFTATFDLGTSGLPWTYQGSFRLRLSRSTWRVVWSPSVIAPGLRPGDRLAVVTSAPGRAALFDSAGHSLFTPSPVIELGVVPDEVKHPVRTADLLARAVHLGSADAIEIWGQMQAAPPNSFFELLALTPSQYSQLSGVLSKVPDLRRITISRRLFDSTVPDVTGQIGTEIAPVLRTDGVPYRPGTTIGLSGLERTYQNQLTGTPTTEVVVQNRAGHRVAVLKRWPGRSGAAVHTTIDPGIQRAAQNALAGLGYPAAIVATRAGGGQILAVASHAVGGMPDVRPLTGAYQPGQAFTIVSTMALLRTGSVTAARRIPCRAMNLVGSQTFTNMPPEPRLRNPPTFADDFARACRTAFAGLSLSYYLSPSQLAKTVADLGVGSKWQLPIPAFPGYMRTPTSGNTGVKAADVVGDGTVRVSPLAMALAAGAVESGSWRPPVLVTSPATASGVKPVAFQHGVTGTLRTMMRAAVTSGAARGASVRHAAVYGQVGIAPLAGHNGLLAIWFVGFRGDVAFTVVAFSPVAAYAPATQIAQRFAAALSPRA
jgi:cell division protein FtsI/penicillin-binding protein 2